MLYHRKLRSLDITKFQIQFSIAMICMLLTFMIGVERTESVVVCTIMSVTLQYFVLATMMWMAAQAVLMFRKLVLVFGNISKKFLISTSIVCWSESTDCVLFYIIHTIHLLPLCASVWGCL